MWSTHSRRIDPINRSTKPFCQGEAGAIGLSRMPMARSRRGRARTCRGAAATLSPWSLAILTAYVKKLGIDLAPNAPIFRNRSGAPYSKDTLGDDFRDVRVTFDKGDRGSWPTCAALSPLRAR